MIKINQLNFSYPHKKPLFKNLDLELTTGNIYGLLGRNGAGKTSLLKLMAGLHFLKAGGVNVFGHQPKDRHPALLGDLYFLPEDLYLPNLSIKNFAGLHAPFYPNFSADDFAYYLREFGLDAIERISGMSFGQKKKVLLGFSLSTNTRLLLLDEPTNGLDIPSKSQFRKLMSAAASDERIIIISTHQVRDMANLIDPIIILDDGEIIFNDSLQCISEKLYFEVIPSIQPPEDVLYAERVPGGYLAVRSNESHSDSEVDIEVFFNALVSKQSSLREIFMAQPVH